MKPIRCCGVGLFVVACQLQQCCSFNPNTPSVRMSTFKLSVAATVESNTIRWRSSRSSSSRLDAKKKSRSSSSSSSSPSPSTGFGGAAAEPCPCGLGLGYAKCCGKLHQDPTAFASAAPSQVVRARYTAYAKRKIDFIMASTHPLNHNFMEDIQHWKKIIEDDCYDNFELTQCQILEENIPSDKEAVVKFVAHMTQVDTRGRSAFMETSTFERGGELGAWLYRDGVIEAPPSQEQFQVVE